MLQLCVLILICLEMKSNVLDKQDLLDESEDIAEIIKECNGLIQQEVPSVAKQQESRKSSA